MLDELKIKYKNLNLYKRLIICVLAGLLPGVYLYYDQAAIVEEEFAAAEAAEKDAAQKLLDVDKKLKNLEQTERDLAFTTEQLKKAETILPSSVAIDEILRQVGKSAKSSSLMIMRFEPKPEAVKGDEYKYIEMPFDMEVEASEYSQICSWLDSIAGLKARIYVKSWALKREVGREKQAAQGDSGANGSGTENDFGREELLARRARENLRLKLTANFAVYRIAPDQPAVAPQSSPDPSADGVDAGVSAPAESAGG